MGNSSINLPATTTTTAGAEYVALRVRGEL